MKQVSSPEGMDPEVSELKAKVAAMSRRLNDLEASLKSRSSTRHSESCRSRRQIEYDFERRRHSRRSRSPSSLSRWRSQGSYQISENSDTWSWRSLESGQASTVTPASSRDAVRDADTYDIKLVSTFLIKDGHRLEGGMQDSLDADH